MLTILVVDDNPDKLRRITNVIADTLTVGTYELDSAETVFEGGAKLKRRSYDLMVIDVQLPMRQNEEPRKDGGIELLRQIRARREYNVPHHVVGLTAYDDSIASMSDYFEEYTWVLLHYKQACDQWAVRLTHILEHVAAAKKVVDIQSYDVDIGIVTALDKPELQAVLALDAGWKRTVVPGDDTFYHVGTFSRKERSFRVVAASSAQMGMPSVTGLSMKLCMHFKPRLLAMCGIAAGVKGEHGDVLVAERSWDYGTGKRKLTKQDNSAEVLEVFEPAPTAIPMDLGLLEKIKVFAQDESVLKRIEFDWPGQRTAHPLRVQIGSIASGAAVLANKNIIDSIVARDRKVIGVEMEVYGVYLAAMICPAPRPRVIAMKSICDFGDSQKGDEFQAYAAYTSARSLFEFALSDVF